MSDLLSPKEDSKEFSDFMKRFNLSFDDIMQYGKEHHKVINRLFNQKNVDSEFVEIVNSNFYEMIKTDK